MKTMNLRVVDKSGNVLGRVSTLGVFKGSVSYVKADESGVVIDSFSDKVDIQYSFDGQVWETILIPMHDISDMLDDLRIMRGA